MQRKIFIFLFLGLALFFFAGREAKAATRTFYAKTTALASPYPTTSYLLDTAAAASSNVTTFAKNTTSTGFYLFKPLATNTTSLGTTAASLPVAPTTTARIATGTPLDNYQTDSGNWNITFKYSVIYSTAPTTKVVWYRVLKTTCSGGTCTKVANVSPTDASAPASSGWSQFAVGTLPTSGTLSSVQTITFSAATIQWNAGEKVFVEFAVQTNTTGSSSGGWKFEVGTSSDTVVSSNVSNGVITAGTTGSQVASLLKGTTGDYIGGAFTFARNFGTGNITQMTITETGTVNGNTNLANAKLFYDVGSCTYTGGESQFGSSASFNTSEKATFTGSLAITATQACFYVVLDVGSGASAGQTFDIQVANPSTDVVASAGTSVSPATPVAIAGSTAITAGTLSADTVDGSGNSVASPTISFPGQTFLWQIQQSLGTLGVSAQKIRVTNTTATSAWTLSLAASGGNSSVWTRGPDSYDFNGTYAQGRLQVDPSGATITPQSGCTTTGISKGSANYFVSGTQDSINVAAASGSAGTNCYWDITGVGLTQDIPAGQTPGSYIVSMTLSII